MINITITHELEKLINKMNRYPIDLQNALADASSAAEDEIIDYTLGDPSVNINIDNNSAEIQISGGYLPPEYLDEIINNFGQNFDMSFEQFWGAE